MSQIWSQSELDNLAFTQSDHICIITSHSFKSECIFSVHFGSPCIMLLQTWYCGCMLKEKKNHRDSWSQFNKSSLTKTQKGIHVKMVKITCTWYCFYRSCCTIQTNQLHDQKICMNYSMTFIFSQRKMKLVLIYLCQWCQRCTTKLHGRCNRTHEDIFQM